MIIAISELSEQVDKLVAKGKTEEEIIFMIQRVPKYEGISIEETKQLIESIKILISEHANYVEIQSYMTKMLVQFPDSGKMIIYDEQHKVMKYIRPEVISRVMDFKQIRSKIKNRNLVYNPEKVEKLYEEKGARYFNSYNAPFWREELKGTEVPVAARLPEVYTKFFAHITDDNARNIDFIFQWAAQSLRAKNFTVLAAIGVEGAGKGLLFDILGEVHGFDKKNPAEGNFGIISGTKLGERFNGGMSGKTLVHFDEVKLVNKQEQNNFKMLINATIEVEKKGTDAKNEQNFANLLCSANEMEDIKVSPTDRRFSFLDITNTPLRFREGIMENLEDFCSALLNHDNIRQLAYFLWHYPRDFKLLASPFTSDKAKSVRLATLQPWEVTFVESYCKQFAGKTMILADTVETLVKDTPGSKPFQMTAPKFMSLHNKVRKELEMHPGKWIFRVERQRLKDKSRPNVVVIAPEKEQPNVSLMDNFQALPLEQVEVSIDE